jgi:hypothetical protein
MGETWHAWCPNHRNLCSSSLLQFGLRFCSAVREGGDYQQLLYVHPHLEEQHRRRLSLVFSLSGWLSFEPHGCHTPDCASLTKLLLVSLLVCCLLSDRVLQKCSDCLRVAG